LSHRLAGVKVQVSGHGDCLQVKSSRECKREDAVNVTGPRVPWVREIDIEMEMLMSVVRVKKA